MAKTSMKAHELLLGRMTVCRAKKYGKPSWHTINHQSSFQLVICSKNQVPGPGSKTYYPVPNPGNCYLFLPKNINKISKKLHFLWPLWWSSTLPKKFSFVLFRWWTYEKIL